MTTKPMSPAGLVNPSNGGYDAFLSYSSADRQRVKRVQAFLESYRFGNPRRRVRVFLDHTDIRGGELGGEISGAIQDSRTLIVCYSPAAAESMWVAREIEYGIAAANSPNIALVELGGDVDAAPFLALKGLEYRRHDLRKGWWFFVLKPRARLELLRLLAFVTDVDLRVLRNWHRRRQLAHAAMVTFAMLALFALVFSIPMKDWETIDLRSRGAPLYAIAAEVDGGALKAVSRYRAPGPQGFRNYLRVAENALSTNSPFQLNGPYSFRTRLLPVPLAAHPLRSRAPGFSLPAVTWRESAKNQAPLIGEPRPGWVVSVVPLAPTDDERQEYEDRAADFGFALPVPAVVGSVVAVDTGSAVHAVEVPDLSPVWRDTSPSGDPTSPSHGLAIACGNGGSIWIGLQGWDGLSSGGLWFSPNEGRTWERVPGFNNVVSVAVRGVGANEEVTVAEGHIDLWQGSFLAPYPTRVVTREARSKDWRAAAMPPFGTRSEVELCGVLGAAEVVRVDETLYRGRRVPLWRFLWDRTRRGLAVETTERRLGGALRESAAAAAVAKLQSGSGGP
ncbi:MAG: toll/interleukin-1 receptor domain-containing protein [Verrucomicrobiales bacterium]|nr:toll/interleukin-1 receptor domain-containing protein [Verrucomicrobiales bacterium]